MGKIIETYNVHDWEIFTNDGWVDIHQIHKTIKYDVWEIKTNNHYLHCADEHIIMDENFNEKYVKDLKFGDRIITDSGIESIKSITKLNCESQHMYDMSISSYNHTYFTNGILSHNTTISTVYLLHYILFNKDKNVAIIANKEKTALEIMQRVKMAFELLPLWLQQGIKEGGWNKSSIRLENGMTVKASTTSSDSISGETISLLYMDEFAKVKPHIANEFITATYPVVSSGKTSKIIMVSCVTDDTFVVTHNGIKEVSDFINYNQIEHPNFGYVVDNYSVCGKGKFNNGNIIVNSGDAKINIIKSPSSYIKCSDNHSLIANKNGQYWKSKSNTLSVGDYIAVQYGMEMWGTNDDISSININNYGYGIKDYRITKITKDFAYFMGLYISEGCAKKHDNIYTGITLTCGDNLSEILNKLNYTYYYDDKFHYTVSSRILCDILINLGFDLSNHANTKIIPKRLFEMSRENIIAMIQGIMDGDGCSQINKGTISIRLSSKRLIEQIRMILNNFGILSIYSEGITKPTKKVKVSSKFYKIELNNTMSNKYYNKIGFRFNRKQLNQKYICENIKRDSYDIIPYSKDIIMSLRNTHKNDYNKIVLSGILKGNYKKNHHFSRTFMLNNKDFLLSINNEIINELYDYINENIKWERITNIDTGYEKVYDFSLDNIDGDRWCHSVMYNGIIGFQTPVGMNHFYQFWADAVRGPKRNGNNFFPIKVGWWEHPHRNEEWKAEMIRDIGAIRFSQEFGCTRSNTYINIKNKNTQLIEKIKISDLYDKING